MQNNGTLLSAVAKEQLGGHVDAVALWRRRASAHKSHGLRTVRRDS